MQDKLQPLLSRRQVVVAGLTLMGAQGISFAQASYPTQPIRVILPFGPGGLADISMRLVAQKLSEKLGQQVIVDNRPGAGGIVAANVVLSAPHDGYTLTLFANGTAISKSLFKLKYDPETDFIPISTMAYFDLILLVRKDSPIKDLAGLQALAKTREINIGTINPGSTQNLSAELFKTTAKLRAQVIPFKSTPEVLTALIRGDVDVGFESYAALKGAVDTGQIRAIAATGSARSAWLPNVPTVKEAGVPGYEVSGWNSLYAPAGTPPAVIQTLNAAMREVMQMPDVKRRLLDLGTEAKASTSAEMAEIFKADASKWGQVIKESGIKVE